MKQKIKKMFLATLLSVAILGMSAPALQISASDRIYNESEHEHAWIEDPLLEEFIAYTNVSDYTHQKKVCVHYHCSGCNATMTMDVLKSEPHSPDPKTQRCACGYIVH